MLPHRWRPALRTPVRPRAWTTTRAVALVSFLAQLFFYIPALTPYLRSRGLDVAQINSLQTILIATWLLLNIPTGVLADRIGRRHTYSLGLACQVLAESTFLIARTYPVIALSSVLSGAGYALAAGSVDALVYESLPEENRGPAMQRAMGTVGGAVQLASLVAYLAGGALVADLRVAHIRTAIELTVLCMLAAFIASFAIPEVGRNGPEPVREPHPVRTGLHLLRRNHRLRRVVLAYLLTEAFPVYLLVLYQLYFLQTGAGGRWLGPGLALGSALALLGQRYAFKLEAVFGAVHAVRLVTLLPGLFYLLMAVNRAPVLAVLLFCLQWGVIPMKEPLFAGYTNIHISDTQRATVLSVVGTIGGLYVATMGPMIGRIADASLSEAFLFMGVLVLVGGLIFRVDEQVVNGDGGQPPD